MLVASTPLLDRPDANALEAAWRAADKAPLPETTSAINRIPEAIRSSVAQALDREFKLEFMASMSMHSDSGPDSIERKPSVLAHSAKLMVYSTASYLAFMPWHVIDGELITEIQRSLAKGVDVPMLHEVIRRSGAVNLFVAARESDDRDSYIRTCKSLLGRVKVAYLVLDSEICSFSPDAAVCTDLGLSGCNIGISDRDKSSNHSFMNARGLKAVYIDTGGKQLGKSAHAIAEEQEALVAQSVPPPANLESRLARLKSRQAAARKPQ